MANVAVLAETSASVKLRLTIRLPSEAKQKTEMDDNAFSHVSAAEVGSKKVRVVFGSPTNETVIVFSSGFGRSISWIPLLHAVKDNTARAVINSLFIELIFNDLTTNPLHFERHSVGKCIRLIEIPRRDDEWAVSFFLHFISNKRLNINNINTTFS